MHIADILLIVLIIILLGTVVVSVMRFMIYSQLYPIKQLSPRVTSMIAVAIGLSCCILACIAIFIPPNQRQDNPTIDICCLFYVYFRQVAIIGFTMRCLRICIAYSKRINCRPIIRLFSSEMLICLATCLFSLILPIVQIIERYALKWEVVSEFFHFYSVEGARRPFSIALWIIDNGMFFCVLALSTPINNMFKFIKSLILVFVLYRLQTWYKLIYLKIFNTDASVTMQQYYHFVPIIINILCLLVLIYPTFRRRHRPPLPNDVIISSHSMLFKYGEAYFILFQFARHLQNKPEQKNEKKQFTLKQFVIYSELIVAIRKSKSKRMDDSSIEIQQQVVNQFLVKQVVPNYADLPILQMTTNKLFEQGKVTAQSIKPSLRIQDLTLLKQTLQKVMKYIYNKWQHTVSNRELKKELEANTPIIEKMGKLDISIT